MNLGTIFAWCALGAGIGAGVGAAAGGTVGLVRESAYGDERDEADAEQMAELLKGIDL